MIVRINKMLCVWLKILAGSESTWAWLDAPSDDEQDKAETDRNQSLYVNEYKWAYSTSSLNSNNLQTPKKTFEYSHNFVAEE